MLIEYCLIIIINVPLLRARDNSIKIIYKSFYKSHGKPSIHLFIHVIDNENELDNYSSFEKQLP